MSVMTCNALPTVGLNRPEGDAPHQLALAILADHLDDEARALELSEGFMKAITSDLDNDWTLTI